MDEAAIRSRLPAPIAHRLQAVRINGGTVSLVVDAHGLDEGARQALDRAAKEALRGVDGVTETRVALVADRPAPAAGTPAPPPASPAAERRSAVLQPPPPGVPPIIAVGSGKGGVGKSTLTANLAVALHRAGRRVGVVDADIYGPSIARIFATEDAQPESEDGKLVPVTGAGGIPALSMGHLIEAGRAIAWRGPMIAKAMAQLIDAHWGEAEMLLVDLPPGTGDVQLTMVQRFRPAGAVIVSTPQDLALIDARRAANLFEVAGVPLVGLVENMAGYECPHCHEISDPFGRGGVEAAAAGMQVPFLGRIPLALEIREGGDSGNPPAAGEGPQAQAFHDVANKLSDWLTRHGIA
ncbi:Mrp/NBP35 family ATP-binding protein [Pseudopontixanthobacter vadosimaris]|uniref:Mrp/NBP35 family ATP-binding protein n=1 Tax=Pseudopontixanthobacter vadosimaris TaxID=2726450 RepID=UPI0014750D1A|nr:Mrp/NBP35 family ATP-binding protein [Pseudopontixanthobacter vadosimaris]